MESGIHIALAPEQIGSFLGLTVTNTLLTSWIVVVVLITIAILIGSRLKIIPSRPQVLFEWLVEFVYDYIAEILEFTPGIGSIGLARGTEFIPLFRSVNTDLNVTLMLAIMSFLVIEVTGVVVIGAWKYAGKFLNFHSFIGFFVGIVEFFSEVARIIAFSFRLFGNIFAGEVLILVVVYFLPVVAPVPVMAFEIFVGFVQAAIFALLTLFFIKIAITESH